MKQEWMDAASAKTHRPQNPKAYHLSPQGNAGSTPHEVRPPLSPLLWHNVLGGPWIQLDKRKQCAA